MRFCCTKLWLCLKHLQKTLDRPWKSLEIFGYDWFFFENPNTPREKSLACDSEKGARYNLGRPQKGFSLFPSVCIKLQKPLSKFYFLKPTA